MVATPDNVRRVSTWNCSTVIGQEHMAAALDPAQYPPCAATAAAGRMECSCPAGYTDDHFATADERARGYGVVPEHDLRRVTCARPCGEHHALIMAKAGYTADVCGCQAAMGCRFVPRVLPRAADVQTIMVIPDDLREATRVVHCYHGGAGTSSAVDLLLCADLGVDYLHDHTPSRPQTCRRGQYLDPAQHKCTECSRCSEGHGEAQPCSAVTDTRCVACAPSEYVSPHDRRCHSCDADQEWDAQRQRCVRQQRNIYQGRCAQQPGHVFLPWTQTCAPCPRNTRQVENRCSPCAVNSYTRGPNATTCLPCPSAHVRAAGDAECRECPVGMQAASECMPCARQSVRVLGVEACVMCAPGYRAVDGARCEPCEGTDCVPCEDGMYLAATDRQCYPCRKSAPGACPEGEQWVCSKCEQDPSHDTGIKLVEQYTLPLRSGYEAVLAELKMRYAPDYAACVHSRLLEETKALLYASDAFLRGSVSASYQLCCDDGYAFEKDTEFNLYYCGDAE